MFADPSERLSAALSKQRERLLNLPQDSDTLRYLTSVASIVTDAFLTLGKNPPIVVGGLAVEAYTAGGYTTLDVDMITFDGEATSQVMSALGFRKRPGRHYEHPSIKAFVEFPSGPLDGSTDRITEIKLDDGTSLYVIGIEDIILDRVAAYVNWDKRNPDSPDAAQAVLLLVAQRVRIDLDYLKAEASSKGLADGLADVLRRAEAVQ
jgi:hypothetical protein